MTKAECKLYHFTNLNVSLEKILTDRVLKLSHRQDLDTHSDHDDPNDSFLYSIYINSIGRMQIETNNEDTRTAEKLKTILNDNMKILSFCADRNNEEKSPLQKSFDIEKPRMWSQYSSGHSGVCLIFDKDKFIDKIREKFINDKHYKYDYITYRDYPIKMEAQLAISETETVQKGAEVYIDEYINKNHKSLLFTKHKDYETESEFRLCYWGDKQDCYIPFGDSLREIVLGANVPLVYDILFKNLALNNQCKLFRLSPSMRGLKKIEILR